MAETVIAPSGGGAGGTGAPTTADYLVRTADAGLSAERVVTDTATVVWDWTTPGQAKATAITGGTGDVVGPAGAIDGEVVLYSGVTGKLIKRATGTGITRALAGVYVTPSELSGDVATSGSNAVTIAANAVTYAKMQDISAASRLLGRGSAAGAGDPEEILLGTNLSMSGTTLNATGGSGGTPPNVASADVTVNNSVTFVNATGLKVTIGASATEAWWFEAELLLSTASTSPDWKFQWTLPSGATIFWAPAAQGTSSFYFVPVVIGGVPTLLLTAASVLQIGSGAGIQGVTLSGWIFGGGTGGNVQLQFAQNVAVASANTIKRGSFVLPTQVLT